jgi:hypothetical protein
MLAEIFMVQLEAAARVSQAATPQSNSRFVPFVLSAQQEFRNGRANPTDVVLEASREKASDTVNPE